MLKLDYYRDFKLTKLCSKKFSHLLLLIYWAIYGALFYFVEFLDQSGVLQRSCVAVECPLDFVIPFNELFFIPYLIWFAYMVLPIVFFLLFDIPSFKRIMWFIIITYSITIVIYLIYPTKQELRPDLATLGRSNFITRFMEGFYAYDTNTNVNPSIHVIGSLAVMFASWFSKHFSSLWWRISYTVLGVLICVSTVFVKQHSVIDVVCGVILSVAVYPFIFSKKALRKHSEKELP